MLGYNNKSIKKSISAKKIIELLEQNNLDINNNTLISIGCFSECWDENNKKETIDIIKYFLKKGNQIQLSTKCKVLKKELAEILPLIKYPGQLIIFVSSATISKHNIYEKNTTSISERFKTFEISKSTNIPVVLYIKPVLQNITINDIDLYKKYIEKYDIKDGSIFSNKKSEETVHFSNKNELFYSKCQDEELIISKLSKITNIYRRSSEVMEKYKN
jgi:DNA repair photolyase